MSAPNNFSAAAASQEPCAPASNSTAEGGKSRKLAQQVIESADTTSRKRFKSDTNSPQQVLVGSSAGALDRDGGSADDEVATPFTNEQTKQFQVQLTKHTVACGFRTSVLAKATTMISNLDQLYYTVVELNDEKDCDQNVELLETFTKLEKDTEQLCKHLRFAFECSFDQLKHSEKYLSLRDTIQRENSEIKDREQLDGLTSELIRRHANTQCLLFLWHLMEELHVDSSGSSILVLDVNGELIEDPNFRTKFEQLLLKIYWSTETFFELPTSTEDMANVLYGCLQCLRKQATNRFRVHGLSFK